MFKRKHKPTRRTNAQRRRKHQYMSERINRRRARHEASILEQQEKAYE